MISLKTEQEIDTLREGGAILSRVMEKLTDMARPGVTTLELDREAERMMREAGGEPSFKGYRSEGDPVAFPSTVCISLNQEVVHAPAEPSREVKSGDLLKMDAGLWYGGLCTDMAVTIPVGKVDPDAMRLVRTTRESLEEAVSQISEGGWISDIGKIVDRHVRKQGFSVVRDLVGHGVGHAVHEDPQIPNYFNRSAEPIQIERGMVLAIEPMVNAGTATILLMPDGWTIVTADGKLSAHFEVTLAVTAEGIEVLTPLPFGL